MVSSIVIITLVVAFCSYYIRCVSKNSKSKARHWSSIPGFCMGVGIAGTFVSLFITFQTYKEGQILSDLIKEVSFAFIGSLVGLGFSLGMTYKIKSKITEIEEEEQKAAGEENNPYKLLQQIVENTSSNKSELEKLNASFDTFNAKTETLNSDMIKEFSKKFEDLMKKVESEAIAKSLGNLETIQRQLSEKLEGIFGSTGSTISQGQTDLKKSVDSLKTALESKIDDINKETTQNTSLAKDTVTITLGEIKTQVANMGSSIAAQAQGVIDTKLESINSTFSTIDEKQQKAVQVQSDIVKKMQSVFEDMETAFNTKIGEISTATDKIQGEIIDMGNNITKKADAVVDAKIQSLEETFKRIEDYQTRSQNALETATNSFKETVEKYEQVNEDKTALIEIIGQQLTELKEVRKNGSKLIENWEDIAKSMEGMKDRINQINGVITQLDNIKTVLLNQQH